MNWITGFLILFSVFTTSFALECFRCTSNDTLDCLEKFMHPNPLRAESCSDVYGARYCIKTTGIYEGVLGTRRFCHDKDLGNKCEFFTHDQREYKGCVYTCTTDGCNGATTNFSYFTVFRNLLMLSTILSFLYKFL
ncbi:hypothetical protein JTE90_017274 [Oedothorax gibbosus]|uniref:Protein sleepless n=1 Tax=Oedothorax gibbosus TaxID=931172 RepID=A0AAV6VGT7_9ARAC|nr:hypothetical protein JTE90_017274 [Oedothorax gibbosus]